MAYILIVLFVCNLCCVYTCSCGATQSALYVGVLVPFLTVYIFNWTIFVAIMVALIRKAKSKIASAKSKSRKVEVKQQCRIALTVSVLFGLGWGFGLAASQAIDVAAIRIIFNSLFTAFTTLQGLFIFILYVVLSPNARKEWKRWVLRREDKGPDTSVSHSSASRGTRSTGVTSAVKSSSRSRTLYNNMYSGNPRKGSYPSEFSSVYDSHAPVVEEMKSKLEFQDDNDKAYAIPQLDYDDVFSDQSDDSDTQSLKEKHDETTFAIPSKEDAALPEEEQLLTQPEDELDTADNDPGCSTFDNPFLGGDGSQLVGGDSDQSLDVEACFDEINYDASAEYSQATYSSQRPMVGH